MNIDDEIRVIVVRALKEVIPAEALDADLSVDDEMEIIGESSPLDSIGLVNLILSLERGIAKEMNLDISLTEGSNIFEDPQALENMASLVKYLAGIIMEARQGQGE
jgi:hypothetical protein